MPQSPGGPRRADVGGGSWHHAAPNSELPWIAEDFGGFFIRTLEFAQNSGNLARVACDDICEDSCEPEEWNPNEFLVTLLKSSKMIPCLFENLQSVKLKG